MSADTAFNQNEVGHCADQVTSMLGLTPLFISKTKISATTAAGTNTTKNNRCF